MTSMECQELPRREYLLKNEISQSDCVKWVFLSWLCWWSDDVQVIAISVIGKCMQVRAREN